VFSLNGKYIIINKQVSAQDNQRPVKKGLQTNVPYISGTFYISLSVGLTFYIYFFQS
jgi:hypothetical protein